MIVPCRHCGREYPTYPSYHKRRPRGGFCSRECWVVGMRESWRGRRLEKRCERCGAVFLVVPCQAKRRYCSQACANQRDRGGKLHRACQQCGRVFPVNGGSYLPGKGKYCSRACYGLSRRKAGEVRRCRYCGAEFRVPPWVKTVHCSRRCGARTTAETKRRRREGG